MKQKLTGFYDYLIFDKDKKDHRLYYAKQGDTDTRGFIVEVHQGGKVMDIEGYSMKLKIKKPDGLNVWIEATRTPGLNKFQIDLTNQAIATPGIASCEMELHGSTGQTIRSKNFRLAIDESNEGGILSENELGDIGKIVEFTKNNLTRLELLDIVALEGIQTQEEVRVLAETDRLSSETIRKSSETLRVANENDRNFGESQRVAAETLRVSNENDRNYSENIRVIDEGIRKTNETTRQSNENGRVAAETLRVSNENDRVVEFSNFENRIGYAESKVVTVEKELYDYKNTMANVNVNQEAKQKVTGYGTINLPKNTANGNVSSSIFGRSLKQELNYNRDTYAEWTKSAGNVGDITGLTFDISQVCTSTLATNLRPSTKYGLLIENVSNTASTSLNARISNILVATLVNAGEVGNRKHIITTGAIITTNNITISRNLAGTGVVKLRNVRIFELPTGSEVETDFTNLTADQLAIKYPYIQGGSAKSTISASRLKSIGKNLFGGNVEIGSINTVNGTDVITENTTRTKSYTRIEPNTSYSLTDVSRWYIYDKNKNLLSTDIVKSIVTNNNAHFIRFIKVGGTLLNTKFQLERGTVATPYEPYKETTAYLPNVGELRSLPNGTRDEVRVSDGKAEKVQRTKRFTLNGSESGGTTSSLGNTLRFYLDNAIPLDSTIMNGSNISCDTLTYSPSESDIKGFYMFDGTKRVGLKIPKEELNSLDVVGVKKWLQANPITLTYQLANAIITPIQTSGNLISQPSGTIYIENVVADAGVYNTKFDIKELQLPIKSIDKLIKYNFTTGVQTVLDTSLAVINADKKSFTHVGLVKGDMVFVDHFYDVESTVAETTIEYYDSRHTIKDTVNNKFYKWDIKSTNGVPTVALTEVL